VNFEEASSFNVAITVFDAAGESYREEFVIGVTDQPSEVNVKPVDLAVDGETSVAIDENDDGWSGQLSAFDQNGDPITFSLVTNPDGMFVLNGDQLQLTRAFNYEALPADRKYYDVTVRASDNSPDGFVDQVLRIAVRDIDETSWNQAPTGFALDGGTQVSVMGGEGFAGTLSATDPDGDIVSYSFMDDGNTDGTFIIVGDKLQLIAGKEFDYDALPAGHKYVEVTLKARDGQGPSGVTVQTFRINVEDPNVAPTNFTLNGATQLTVAENTAFSGILSATDTDGDPLTFSFADGSLTNGFFEIVNGTTLKLVDGASLDYEALPAGQKFITLALKVTDDHGHETSQVFRINVSGVDEVPDVLSFADGTLETTVKENMRGIALGALLGHDPEDPASALSYSLSPTDTSGGRFEIVDGVLKLVNGAALDYENSGPDHALTVVVRVTDSAGQFKDQALTIHVADVATNDPAPNQNPSALTFSDGSTAKTVQENAVGASVGQLVGTDAEDPASALAFQLLEDQSGRFEIVNRVLKLKQGVALDYEDSGPDHRFVVTVRVWDTQGGFKDQVLTINVGNVADALNNNPDTLTFANGTVTASVQENLIGQTLGTLVGHDPDSDAMSFELKSDPSGRFEIVNGVLKLKDHVSLDYENSGPNHAYAVTVRAWDARGGFKDQVFTIHVDDVADVPNTAPSSLTMADTTIAENIANPSGIAIGGVVGEDAEDGNNLRYILSSDPSGQFEIVDGILRLKAGVVLDYENSGQNHAFDVGVRALDSHGAFIDQTFTVHVGNDPSDDAPEQHPTDILLSGNSIAEFPLLDTVIGSFSTDAPGGFVYKIVLAQGGGETLVDSDGHFKISGGRLLNDTQAGFDFERQREHAITIRVMKEGETGLDDWHLDKAFTISVRDVFAENVTFGDTDDLILANIGNDVLRGGGGSDTLAGGLGLDTLTGGAGNDYFRFDAPVVLANRDVITDFAAGGDQIQLKASRFGLVSLRGDLTAARFIEGTEATTAQQRIIYDTSGSTGRLYYDADGNGTAAKVLFATFNGPKPVLHLSDFDVIG
jgi:Ca2+-binding RTX toxin-like protein